MSELAVLQSEFDELRMRAGIARFSTSYTEDVVDGDKFWTIDLGVSDTDNWSVNGSKEETAYAGAINLLRGLLYGREQGKNRAMADMALRKEEYTKQAMGRDMSLHINSLIKDCEQNGYMVVSYGAKGEKVRAYVIEIGNGTQNRKFQSFGDPARAFERAFEYLRGVSAAKARFKIEQDRDAKEAATKEAKRLQSAAVDRVANVIYQEALKDERSKIAEAIRSYPLEAGFFANEVANEFLCKVRTLCQPCVMDGVDNGCSAAAEPSTPVGAERSPEAQKQWEASESACAVDPHVAAAAKSLEEYAFYGQAHKALVLANEAYRLQHAQPLRELVKCLSDAIAALAANQLVSPKPAKRSTGEKTEVYRRMYGG